MVDRIGDGIWGWWVGGDYVVDFFSKNVDRYDEP